MSRSALIILLACGLFSCGPGDDAQQPGVTIATYRSGLTMSAAGGCSTSIANGLSAQLVEELNCVTPNLMVNFSGSHTNLYTGVNPFLAPGASNALKAATTAKNDFITISSAYRDVGSQYLLYRWWQAGQCGIQLAASPGTSNHQSGRAIDTPNYSYWKTALQNAGWTWLGSSDVVHFDHLASANVASKSVLAFQRLWNKNHSTGRLAEDGVWGPASEAAMAASPVTGFSVHGCATTGKISGTITDAMGGAAVSGVTITAGSQSATTNASGAFELTLGAGTFTVTAAKSGFTSRSLSRTVTLGGTVSASMTLTRVVTQGTLSGKVVDADGGAALAGATVTAGSQMATTSADGAFSFTLPAGSVMLAVSKSGYVAKQQAATLTAGNTTNVTVSLSAAVADAPPVLTITSPASDEVNDLARVELTGTASDDFSAVTEVHVVHNGTPLTANVVGGAFSVPLQLAPGVNSVELSVVDDQGQRTSATWTGSFRAGFAGLVHRFDDALAIVPDAELTLFEPDTDTQVGNARSDLNGAYSLDVTRVGTLRLHVEKDGFTPRDLLVDVSSDERTMVDVGLTPGAVAEIRILEPAADATTLEATEVRIAGVVTGFEVASVLVNGEPAALVGSGFVITLPLPEGRTVFEVIAENGEGAAVRTEVVVGRPMSGVMGGCSTAPPLAFVMLAALLFANRRQRAGVRVSYRR